MFNAFEYVPPVHSLYIYCFLFLEKSKVLTKETFLIEIYDISTGIKKFISSNTVYYTAWNKTGRHIYLMYSNLIPNHYVLPLYGGYIC
jgi:hypothetical protein